MLTFDLKIKRKDLPQDRNSYQAFEYGIKEPEKIPHGKLTLRMFDHICSQYQVNRTKENINELSKKFNFESEKLETLIEYFRPFSAVSQKQIENNKNVEIETVFSNVRNLPKLKDK